MDNLLAVDMPNAVAYLSEMIDTLEKYAAHRRAGRDAAGGRARRGRKHPAEGAGEHEFAGECLAADGGDARAVEPVAGDEANTGADAKSLEFEKRYLEELFATVERTVAIMEELDKLLMKIRNDCE